MAVAFADLTLLVKLKPQAKVGNPKTDPIRSAEPQGSSIDPFTHPLKPL